MLRRAYFLLWSFNASSAYGYTLEFRDVIQKINRIGKAQLFPVPFLH